MRPKTLYLLLPLLALALLPGRGDAQVRFDGLDVSAGYFGWAGTDFVDVTAGPRFAVVPLVRIGDDWNVGIEGAYGRSELQFRQNPIFIDALGLHGMIRRNFADPTGRHLFAGARGGWSRLDSEERLTSTSDPIGSWAQTGWTAGAEAGIGFPAGQYVDIVWAASFGYASYGECNIFGPDDPVVDFGEACSATRWGVRMGIILGRFEG